MDVLEEAKGLLAKAQGEAHPMAWHVPEPLLAALVRELEAARAVVEKVPAVLRLDPGCDDHATGLAWCDRCHEERVAHADLQHAYNATKAGKAVE